MIDSQYFYLEVILPLKLEGVFTYSVPIEWKSDIEIGKRVLVQFGRLKVYSGIVFGILEEKPNVNFTIKTILEIIDEEPIINSKQLQLWNWMAEYYMCEIGMVMDVALPNYFKLYSDKHFAINNTIYWDPEQHTEEEDIVYNSIVSSETISYQELKSTWEEGKYIKALYSLVDKGIVKPVEIINRKYTARYEQFVAIDDKYLEDKDELNTLFEQIQKRSPAQWKSLLNYMTKNQKGGFVNKNQWIKKEKLSAPAVKSMIDKGIFVVEERQVDRFYIENNTVSKEIQLSERQSSVLQDIEHQFNEKSTTLFRGVTGSGKTEIYITLIKKYLKTQKTVLYLLPEIALTQQIISRLTHYLGSDLVVYHSLISHNKRYEIWNKVKSGEIKFLVGTRSSLFLPYESLDLVIIDEEHDQSLKQGDKAPYFNVRDCMLYMSRFYDSKILLGTATPSTESYHNAMIGRFGYVTLDERYGNAILPEIELIPMNRSVHHYSDKLISEVQETIDREEQAVLFQNRRGYSPYLQCEECGHIYKCDQCDVSLTYHSNRNCLICHYCNKQFRMLSKCTECQSTKVKTKGLGTQKVEEEIEIFLKDAKIVRLDRDNASSIKKIDTILSDFKENKYNILIGTQMVSKGLDFENLTLLAVIQTDNFFSFIDYKVDEKAYQTLHQAVGRVGRSDKKGKVILQVFNTEHRVIKALISASTEDFLKSELEIRKELIYPPFCKMIKVVIRHKKENLLNIYAEKIKNELLKAIRCIVVGPTVPPVSRIRNQHIREIMIKIPINKELKPNKKSIKSIIEEEKKKINNSGFVVDIVVDV